MILCHTLSVSAVRSEVTVNSSCCCAQEKLNLTQNTTPVTCNCPWKLSERTRLQRSETELEMMLGVLLTDARYGCLIHSCSSCTCDCRAKRAVPLSSIRGSNSESVSIDSMLSAEIKMFTWGRGLWHLSVSPCLSWYNPQITNQFPVISTDNHVYFFTYNLVLQIFQNKSLNKKWETVAVYWSDVWLLMWNTCRKFWLYINNLMQEL